MEDLSLYSALLFVLINLNLVAFAFMAKDKEWAKKKKRRIPERTFFLIALFGGSFGVWAGMQAFRHKTKHPSFKIGIPLIFLLNIGCIYFLLQL